MSLEYAILGFLNEESLTGYDLKKEFDMSVSHFWNADQGQIYKTLDKLVDKNLVSFEIKYQDEKPNKKVYSITKKGKDSFIEWLKKDIEPNKIRDSFLVKIFFGSNLDNDILIELFENKKKKHQKILNQYLQLKKECFSENNNNECNTNNLSKKYLLQYITLDAGIKYEEHLIKWCDESINKIKKA